MKSEQIIDITTYLLGCFPGLPPQVAEEIAQTALDAAEVAARENRPTLPGEEADVGAHWAKRLGEEKK